MADKRDPRPAPSSIPFHGPFRRWRMLTMANMRVRRDAKRILLTELGEAVRHGMPLDEALLGVCQTVSESWRPWVLGIPQGADRRDTIWLKVSAFFLFIMFSMASAVYVLFAPCFSDPVRVARIVALRLQSFVAAGMPLHVAMRRCRGFFEPEEVAIIEASEAWGRLGEGLKKLGEYQVVDVRINTSTSNALYPFILAGILSLPIAFVLYAIVPKFKDIYDQLGAELPGMTLAMIRNAHITGGLLPSAAFIISTLLMLFVVIRTIMNGNVLSRYLFAIATIALGGWAAVAVLVVIMENNAGTGLMEPIAALFASLGIPQYTARSLSQIVLLPLPFAIPVAGMWLLPGILEGLERMVVRIERDASEMVLGLPFDGLFLGRAARAVRESRWLSALALALESGMTEPEALATAGRISGRSLAWRSDAAAVLAESGKTIGEAVAQAGVLSPRTAALLVLVDGRPGYTEALRGVADDAALRAHEVMTRTSRLAEVCGTFAIAMVAAFFVIAMYLPLFNIPRIVGNEAFVSLDLRHPASGAAVQNDYMSPTSGETSHA